MLTHLYVSRDDVNKRDADVLDVCEVLSIGTFGTPNNALMAMVRESKLFLETLRQLEVRRSQGAMEVTPPQETTA